MGPDRPDRREEPARGGAGRALKVIVLGGTRFIGRATVEELAAAGDELMVVHRGELEPDDLPDVQHVHCDRSELAAHCDELAKFGPDALVDCRALSRADAEVSLAALPEVERRIVISSMDVYRAFGALLLDRETDPVPIDEESPVRVERYPYRGRLADRDDYDKLDVEDVYLPRGALVLRLPMVYGEHDYQLREEFILRRVRAGRQRIPIGDEHLRGPDLLDADVGEDDPRRRRIHGTARPRAGRAAARRPETDRHYAPAHRGERPQGPGRA
ncbi:MAG: NAD-dependent epimerase/dehydratase family protein [Chloroflexi bacterium]|nr:MAG: NAD-dependent epimerase/dehydratase family protein [Chloroflexota bacterium]